MLEEVGQSLQLERKKKKKKKKKGNRLLNVVTISRAISIILIGSLQESFLSDNLDPKVGAPSQILKAKWDLDAVLVSRECNEVDAHCARWAWRDRQNSLFAPYRYAGLDVSWDAVDAYTLVLR